MMNEHLLCCRCGAGDESPVIITPSVAGGGNKVGRQRMKLSITQASGKYKTIRGRQSMLVLINYSLKVSRAAAGVESLYSFWTDLKKTFPPQ